MDYKITINLLEMGENLRVGDLPVADSQTLSHYQTLMEEGVPFVLQFNPNKIDFVQHGFAIIDGTSIMERSPDQLTLTITIADKLKILLITEAEFRSGTNRLANLN